MLVKIRLTDRCSGVILYDNNINETEAMPNRLQKDRGRGFYQYDVGCQGTVEHIRKEQPPKEQSSPGALLLGIR